MGLEHFRISLMEELLGIRGYASIEGNYRDV